jgi:hypothetical protein
MVVEKIAEVQAKIDEVERLIVIASTGGFFPCGCCSPLLPALPCCVWLLGVAL